MKRLLFSLAVSFMVAKIPTPVSQKEFKTINKYTSALAYDAIGHVYYAASARTGAVGKYTADGKYEMLYSNDTLKMSSALKITPDGRTLYFCVGEKTTGSDSPKSSGKALRLIAIDSQTGKTISDVDLSNLEDNSHYASDLTFDANGNTYITDSGANAIYKVAANGKASIFSKSRLFGPAAAGLNSIVWHPDGFLLANNTLGDLFKINISQPELVQKVTVSNISFNTNGLLLNDNKTLTLLQKNDTHSAVYQLISSDNWISAVVRSGIDAETSISNHKEAWVLTREATPSETKL